MSGGRGDELAARLGLGLGAESRGGAAWVAPSPEALAEAIPGVRVTGLAGRGGMGVVYRAEQTRLGRMVAVKVLAPAATGSGAGFDPLAEERFEREARVLAGLAHPHVLQIHDAGRLRDGTRYLVTEWAEGGDLAALSGRKPQPARVVAGWVAQVAAALDAAHGRGVVHRDLKPANVLVRGDGRLALADFGLARAEGAGFTTALTLSGVVQGTADYMAPEQLRGEPGAISPATDVYALGVMTYELLTGRVPRGVFAPASRAAGVPEAVDRVIAAAMADEPGRRTATAGEFARALERATRERGMAARLGGLLVAGGVAVGVAGWWAWREEGGSRPEAAVVKPAAVVEVRPAAGDGKVMEAGKRDLLPSLELASAPQRGGWSRSGRELSSDGDVCWIGLPEAVPADFRYEVVVEFTRLSGRNSVGVFLPTSAGVGVFELDAWEAGLGGWQMIDGRDLRENGTGFRAALANGERQQVHLVVEGARVEVTWNGVYRGAIELGGRRFEVPWLWEAQGRVGLGLCAWKSPTVFHRVDYRAR